MTSEVVLIVGGVLVAGAFALASRMSTGIAKQANPSSPFVRNNKFISSEELDFYQLLKKAAQKNDYILLKIHLESLVKLPLDAEKYDEWRDHALHMKVDYLLCDRAKMVPYLAIDYNDEEAMNHKQKYHSILKEKILQDAGISFICYDLNREYEVSELSEDIKDSFQEFKNSDSIPE